jgi:hypothetical protein
MNCTFLLNYGEEMNRNQNQRLEEIICFADIIKPSIGIFESSRNAKKGKYKFEPEYVAGSNPTKG